MSKMRGNSWLSKPDRLETTVEPRATMLQYTNNIVSIVVSEELDITICNYKLYITNTVSNPFPVKMISIGEVFVPRCHWSSSSSEGSCQQIHPFHNPQVFDESWIHLFHETCVSFGGGIPRNVYGRNLQTKNGAEVIPNVSSAKRSSKRDATDMAVASCRVECRGMVHPKLEANPSSE